MICRIAFIFAICIGGFASTVIAQPGHWYPPHPYGPYPYPHHYHPPYYPPYHPPGWNPTIAQTRNHVDGFHFNPYTGRWTVDTTQDKVKESATDPNRGHVDPGSLRYVNRWQGNTHVTGTRWTSYGVPHSNLQYHTVGPSGIPGVDHSQTTNVFRSTAPGGGGAPPNPDAANQAAKDLHARWDIDKNGTLDPEEFRKGLNSMKSPQ